MYVKSTAVFMQALGIISIGTLADNGYWRKRLLVTFAAVGSVTASIFLVLPGTPRPSLPPIAALITLVGNITYAGSIVCANAFLPGLAREDPQVVNAREAAEAEVGELGVQVDEGELEGDIIGESARPPPHDLPLPALDSDEEEARALLSSTPPAGSATAKYRQLLSRTMSRLSSTGVAIGFFSGVAMLALLAIPVGMGGGSSRSLMLAVGLSAAWWGVFTIPAALGLPGGSKEKAPKDWLPTAWRRVSGMIKPGEIRQLPNLFTYLLAWIFLSDGESQDHDLVKQAVPPSPALMATSIPVELTPGFHTTTYTAILYASSHLHMNAAKVIVIGLLMQLVAVGSSIYAPKFQRRFGLSNLKLLLYIVLAAQVLPLYACMGLVVPFGGLRTEAEMYVAAAWFGFVSAPPRDQC